MRITNNMMINNMNRNLNRNLVNMDQRQNQIATGKRIHKPSDDPIGTTRIMQLKSYIRQLDQNHSAAEDALSWMGTSESVANQYVDALQRARELTVQAANGSLTSSETSKIQEEIKEIKEHIIGLGNTSHGGKYIFSGKEIDQPLLNPDGSYNDAVHQKLLENPNLIDDQIKYTIGMNETMPINLTGLELFEDQGALTDWSGAISLPEAEVGSTESIDLMGFRLNVETETVQFGDDPVTVNEQGHVLNQDDERINTDGDLLEEGDTPATVEDLNMTYSMTLERMAVDDDDNIEMENGEVVYTTIDLDDLEAVDGKAIFNGLENQVQNAINEFLAEEDEVREMNQAFIQQQMLKASPGADDINPENIDNFLNSNENSFLYEGKRIYRLENFNFETTAVSSNNLQENKDSNYQKQIAFSASPKKPGVMQMLEGVEKNLLEGNQEALSDDLGDFDRFMDVALTARSTLGARVNRGTLVRDRIESDRINFREQLSNVEDVDMAETITKLMNEENVYRASLSVGARIVQPTLIDFLR